jgi:hypothetical protein
MSEEGESQIILPEKKLYVLDQMGYYSLTSTTVDRSKSGEPGVTESQEGDYFIIKKDIVDTFDVPSDIKTFYDEWLPPIVSVKDKRSLSVFIKKDCFDKLDPVIKSNYDLTPIIFYKKKDSLDFGDDIAICYVIFDNNEVSAIPINSGSSSVTVIPLSSFNPDNQLIVVNYKKQILFFISSSDYATLSSEEKSEYDDIQNIFYKKKTKEELRKTKEIELTRKVTNENKVKDEYEKLLKEYNDSTNELFTDEYHYSIRSYRDDPEYKAVIKLSGEKGLLFKPTYKDTENLYFRLFKDKNAYNRFLLKQPPKGEGRAITEEMQYEIDESKENMVKEKKQEDESERIKKESEKIQRDKRAENRASRTNKGSFEVSGGSKNKTRKLYPPRNILSI